MNKDMPIRVNTIFDQGQPPGHGVMRIAAPTRHQIKLIFSFSFFMNEF